MQLFDIGANLSHSAFSQDLPQTIGRARDAGVTRIIVTGTTVDESMAAIRIAEEFGLHAHAPACIRTTPATAARRRSRRCAASPRTRASSRSANAASTSTATTRRTPTRKSGSSRSSSLARA